MVSKLFPYTALAVKKYRSPHAQDLSFAKGENLIVTGAAPKTQDSDEDDDDDEDDDEWLVGTSADGSKSGTFPASHVVVVEEQPETSAVASEEKISEKAAVLSEAPSGVADRALPEQQHQQPEEVAESAPASTSGSTLEQDHASPPVVPMQEVTQSVEPKQPSQDLPAPVAEAVPAAASPAAETGAAPPPAKSPPPPAPKPGGLAARIAAFNKAPDAAPSLLPRKPGSLGASGGWKRPAPAPGAPKPVLPGQPAAAAAPAPNARAPVSPGVAGSYDPSERESSTTTNPAFSAADAQASIKMSLKERMAALQRGSAAEADAGVARARPPEVAQKPGRLAAERKNVAIAGMGVVDTSSATQAAAGDAPLSPQAAAKAPPESDAAAADGNAELQGNDSQSEAQSSEAVEPASDAALAEQEDEATRRAAIAKRMAALGGRRMGAPMFGSPATQAPDRQSSTGDADSVTSPTAASAVEDGDALPPKDDPASAPWPPADDKPTTLAVPRRAAPPRRKRSAAREADQAANDAGIEDPQAAESEPATAAATQDVIAAEPEESSPTSAIEAEGMRDDATSDSTAVVSPKLTSGEVATLLTVAAHQQRRGSADTTSTSQSQLELREREKALEDFVRSQQGDDNDGDQLEEEARREVGALEADNHDVARSVTDAASSVASPVSPVRPPSARPPSTRPPIPISSPPPPVPAEQPDVQRSATPIKPPSRELPTPGAGANRGSIIASGPPPLSRSPPPIPKTPGTQADAPLTVPSAAAEDQPSLDSLAASITLAPALAAPKPRHAIAADDSGDEDEEPASAAASSEVATTEPEQASAETQTETEPTEEEQEAQRRAAIARRMAALGGQRIGGLPGMPPPIMGAPMPSRGNSVVVAEEPAPAPPARAIASPPLPPASPPPRPVSAAPPIPAAAKHDPMRRSSVVSITSENNDGSLTRRSSVRPPVPVGVRSRDPSTSEAQDLREEDAEAEETEEPNELEQKTAALQPPALPLSQPPQPPARSAPEIVEAAAVPETPEHALPPTPHAPLHERVSSSAIRPSSRDLDLMPSSQWWRHGLLPLRLPPSVAGRPDASVFVQIHPDQGAAHSFSARVVFDDYASTLIECTFYDDDPEERNTSLQQTHAFPPAKPDAATLQQWSSQVGAAVAQQASIAVAGKSPAVVGDGSSRALVAAVLANTPHALPPVAASYGYPILAQAGATILDRAADPVIRSGDVVTMHGALFSGKKGLTSYSATYGTQGDPAVAIVLEFEEKKSKCRCVLQLGAKRKGTEEVTLRLDDVKQGIVKVFRVAPRQGWIDI